MFRQSISGNMLVQPEAAPLATIHELHRPLRILMPCNVFRLSYRVMRVAEATGAEIYVLGNESNKGLRFSRFNKKFILSRVPIDGTPTPEILDEINRAVAEFKIDIVMPGDAPATRTIIGLRDGIAAPCFPLPTLEQFDALNNKWTFTEICRELGIPCPSSRLFETREDLLRAIDAGDMAFPSLAKPLSLDGDRGIIRLDKHNARARAEKISYSPILVQDFIPGSDIGASVYCEGGKIRSYILHQVQRQTYSTFDNDSVRDALTRFMQRMGSDGVYNFDMRLMEDGRIYYLECNPRFFYKINLSMLTGLNFVQAGVPGGGAAASVAPGTSVRMPKAIGVALPTPWRLTRRDFSMLGYLYSDLLSYVRECLHIDW